MELLMRWLSCLLLCCLSSLALAGIDINSAGASELEKLPGIGPSKAAAIIEYRNQHGPFKSVDELDNVPGIGPSTLANLRSMAECGEGSSGGTAAPPSGSATGGEQSAPPTRASTGGSRININSATASALQDLPGIGTSKAAAIVADRDANGPFKSCEDLDRVAGIGPATVANLKDSCATE
jgi:competence protein ComEA